MVSVKRHIVLMVFFIPLFPIDLFGQERTREQEIEQIIESISESAEDETESALILEDLTRFAEQPLLINSASATDLEKLHFLNFSQIAAIISYREKHGDILSAYELMSLPGLTPNIVDKITPFITFAQPQAGGRKFSRKGRSYLLLKGQRLFPESRGYESVSDSEPPKYLGSPERMYTRFHYEKPESWAAGVTAEKDAGEEFFTGDNAIGFDFYSAFISVQGKGFIKQINVGDYYIRTGQGLNFWSGMGAGKSADALNTMKSGQGIRAYTSTDENRFFRGAAVALGKGPIDVFLFFSNKNRDANQASEEPLVFTSLQTSGLHRTEGELADKLALNESIYGGYAQLKTNHFRMGATYALQKFDGEIHPGEELYKQFYFHGATNLQTGIDYQLAFPSVQLFGELAASENKALAGIQGVIWHPHPQIGLTAVYRNYSRSFHSIYGNAFGESSGVRNEKGLYFGTEILLAPKLKLDFYADSYYFPWLRSNTTSPGSGTDLFTQLTWSPVSDFECYLRGKTETRPDKVSSDLTVTKDVDETTTRFRLHTDWDWSEKITLRNRVEYSGYRKDDVTETGVLAFQDLVFHLNKLKTECWLRYVWYQTDGYNSRIYAYENDVLYHFSIPAFYGEGHRMYMNLKWAPDEIVTFYLKGGYSLRPGLETWGSGNDETVGNSRIDIRALVRIRL